LKAAGEYRLTGFSKNCKDRAINKGRLAQVDRALVSGTKGRAFESRIAHQHHGVTLVTPFSKSSQFTGWQWFIPNFKPGVRRLDSPFLSGTKSLSQRSQGLEQEDDLRHADFFIAVQTLYIEPGSPWENGYIESFNGKFRDELLHGEIFHTLKEAKVLIEKWRLAYNTLRPHSSLNNRPPAPEAYLH
jgi:hypothetical protein